MTPLSGIFLSFSIFNGRSLLSGRVEQRMSHFLKIEPPIHNQDLPSARTLPSPAPDNLDLENTGSIFLKQLLLLLVCKEILQESVGLAAFQEVVTIRSSRRQI